MDIRFCLSQIQRVAIIGLPGSGKSTFATSLANALNVPVHHLDQHVFEPDGKKKDLKERLIFENAISQERKWVIEGCSLSTLEVRVAQATDVIYFCYPRLFCLWRIVKRACFFDKKLLKTGCLRGVNWLLIKYIWTFKKSKGPLIAELLRNYPQVRFHLFCKPKDVDTFMQMLFEER